MASDLFKRTTLSSRAEVLSNYTAARLLRAQEQHQIALEKRIGRLEVAKSILVQPPIKLIKPFEINFPVYLKENLLSITDQPKEPIIDGQHKIFRITLRCTIVRSPDEWSTVIRSIGKSLNQAINLVQHVNFFNQEILETKKLLRKVKRQISFLRRKGIRNFFIRDLRFNFRTIVNFYFKNMSDVSGDDLKASYNYAFSHHLNSFYEIQGRMS